MKRFLISSKDVVADKVSISDSGKIHYVKNVLRLVSGKKVVLLDEKANEYSCMINEISDKVIIMDIKQIHPYVEDSRANITFACAIPKTSKMDDIIDKLTQLGVSKIIPLLTERVIVKLDIKKQANRLMRWRKIAVSAMQQSQRKKIVVVSPVQSIEEVLSHSKEYDLKLIPALIGKRIPLRRILEKHAPKNILILIGPEGDFTKEELDLAESKGCIPVSLGDNVLRVETAAVAVASFIHLYENS